MVSHEGWEYQVGGIRYHMRGEGIRWGVSHEGWEYQVRGIT